MIAHTALWLAAGLCLAALTLLPSRPGRARVLIILAGALLVTSVAVMSWVERYDFFVPTPTASLCVGTTPQVCGPEKAAPVLEIAAGDLGAAYSDLDRSGLTLPSTYRLLVGDNVLAKNEGALDIDPSVIRKDHLTRHDIISNIANPRQCAAYYAEDPPMHLFAAKKRVTDWLSKRAPRQSAPATVKDAFRQLTECSPYAGQGSR